MQRFDNVDVFASLNALMKQNTGFYQSDLEIDKVRSGGGGLQPHGGNNSV